MTWFWAIIAVIAYFLIGSFMTGALVDDGDDVMAMVVFLVWPAFVTIIVVHRIVIFSEQLTDLLNKIGGDNDGLV